MKWEFLGKQELHDDPLPRKGHTYQILLWRSPVPGGWMLMSVNSRSNDPQPTVSFYPDPTHSWTGVADPQADYLLRPASGAGTEPADQLLRAASGEAENAKLLEP